jgi:hypothetical protein
MKMAGVVFTAMLPLTAACGPISVEQAESQCFLRARQAANPLAGSSVGMGTEGLYVDNVQLSVSSDFLRGSDPSTVYDTCVIRKSGQLPTQPLTSRPDWRP